MMRPPSRVGVIIIFRIYTGAQTIMPMRVTTSMLLLLAATGADALKVAVTGATGKVGRLAVQKLVAGGNTARILLRHPVSEPSEPSDPSTPPPGDADSVTVARYLMGLKNVEAVRGDINDAQSLETLLVGCSAVLAVHGARRQLRPSDFWTDATLDPAHAKNVNFEGIKNLIAAAKASRTCKRIVRITGKGETPWSIFSILINGLGGMAKAWNNEGERLLRAAASDGIEYTIVRPGVMRGEEGDLEPSSLALADDGGDLKVTAIPHGSIASLCIDSLAYPNAAGATLTAMQAEEPGRGESSWAPLLANVKPDRREFRTDLLEAHFTAVRVGGTALALALGAFAFGALSALKAIVGVVVGLISRMLA